MNVRPTPLWQLDYAPLVRRPSPSSDCAMAAAEWILVVYTVVLLLLAKAYYPQHLQRLLDLL